MKTNRRTLLLQMSLLISVAAILTGLTGIGVNIPWQFLLTPYNATNYDGSGIPLPSSKSPVDGKSYVFKDPTFNQPQFISYITSTLPAWQNQSNNKALFDAKNARNIYVDIRNNPGATVQVSYVFEEAGYHNSLGYFLFDADNPPTTKDDAKILVEKIVFPNASDTTAGGSPFGLRSGDSVLLDLTLPAGKTLINGVLGIGFFLVSDGFSAVTGVRTSAIADWIFHSIPGMNTEQGLSANGIPYNEHFVMLQYNGPKVNNPGAGLIALAVEDMNRTMGSDHDFNDLVFGIAVTPEAAIVNTSSTYKQTFYTPAPPVADTDGDGIPDNLDEFPGKAGDSASVLAYNKARASSVWYPSTTGWNTLAYEDLWPAMGDYDMNDLVVNYRYRLVLGADGLVKEVEILYQLMATGANYSNGFGVEFTGIRRDTNQLESLTFQSGATLGSLTPDAAVYYNSDVTQDLSFQIFSNAHAEFGVATVGGAINTDTTKAKMTNQKYYQLNVALLNPVAAATFKFAAPFNPFLFRTQSGKTIEVHLPGHPPTGMADTTLFGTQDDNTSVNRTGNGPFYVSNSTRYGHAGYPWAMDIPSGWKWPTEGTDIVKAYPNFAAWVSSSGAAQPGWYLSPNVSNVYTK